MQMLIKKNTFATFLIARRAWLTVTSKTHKPSKNVGFITECDYLNGYSEDDLLVYNLCGYIVELSPSDCTIKIGLPFFPARTPIPYCVSVPHTWYLL